MYAIYTRTHAHTIILYAHISYIICTIITIVERDYKMASGGEVGLIKAVVIGGTGAIGKHLVGFLLKHKDKVEKVTILGRRKVEVRT